MQMSVLQNIQRRMARLKDLPASISINRSVVTTLLILAAITVTSYLLVDIVYTAVRVYVVQTSTAAAHVSLTTVPHSQAQAAQASKNDDIIVRRNLFQTTLTAIEEKGGPVLPSEEYTAFDLKGTIAVDDEQGFAIVEEKGKGKQKLYRLGEMIGSARLIRVTRNTAVLSTNGRELVMRVKDATEGLSAAGQRFTPAAPGRDISVSRQEVTQNLSDLTAIMSQAVVRPHLKDGVQEGYIITNIAGGSIYERLGLRNNDVIVDVNDKPISTADDLFQLVGVMQSGGSISVNLIRNGKSETLNYSFH